MMQAADNAAASRPLQRRTLDLPVEDVIAGLCMVIVVGAVLWGVVTRYVFPQPAAWSYEVATIGFAWLTFFGAAAGVRYRLHSDIDVFVALFPAPWQHAVTIFNLWMLAFFFAALAIFFAFHTVDAHKSTTIALNMPRSFIYAPLALASAIMLLRHVQIWRDPARFSHHEANIT